MELPESHRCSSGILCTLINKRTLFILFCIIEVIEIALSLILIIKPPENSLRALILSCFLCNIILSMLYVSDNFNLLKTCKNDIISNYYICSIGLCIMLLITTCAYIYYLIVHLINSSYFILTLCSNVCDILIVILVYFYISKYKEKMEEYDNL